MRTTLDIRDDVLQAARELSKQKHISLGEMISDLLSRSLAPSPQESGIGLRSRSGVPLLPVRPQELVTHQKIDLLDQESLG